MILRLESDREVDGRWIVEVLELPGAVAYGVSAKEAQAKARALALRVLADRLESRDDGPELVNISFVGT